jgi:predicted ATPase
MHGSKHPATFAGRRTFPQNSQDARGLTSGMTVAGLQPELVRQMRTALGDLYDPRALAASPLCARLGTDGRGLREVLVAAIDALKPAGQIHTNARAWRTHRLLLLRYVDAQPREAVERELALGTSQYYRDLQSAVETLALHVLAVMESGPPNASVTPRHNLPTRLTSFVGRGDDLNTVQAALEQSRLLTLAGAGGSGKTRLALEAAMRLVDFFADGVWQIDLTALAESQLVAQTVAFTFGVRESPGQALVASLTGWLGDKHMLVMLDNCERLTAACAQLVTAMLRECPKVHVLATSREVLGVAGELVWQVSPLSTIPPAEGHADAVQLFADRASAVDNTFRLEADNLGPVTQICERLDGLPLAIELAAARVRLLSPAQIAARLHDRMQVLASSTHANPPHHRTVFAMVEWSYELLDDQQKWLFERLAVFAGGWTLEAAERVCVAREPAPANVLELLGELVDKSLVIAETTAYGMRYRFLETLRQYAAARLAESSSAAGVADRHGHYYAELALRLEGELFGPSQVAALHQMEVEHNNFRAVLSQAATGAEAATQAAHVAAGISLFWFLRNYFSEARHWLDWVLSLHTLQGTLVASRCLMANGFMAASFGAHDLGTEMSNRAVTEAQKLGDAFTLAWAYSGQAATSFIQGKAATMQSAAAAGVEFSMAADWKFGIALCSAYLGRALLMQRLVDESVEQLRVAIDRSRDAGDPFTIAVSLSFYALAIAAQGEYPHAAAALRESLEQFRELGSFAHQSRVLVDWANIALQFREPHDSAFALDQGLVLAEQLGRVPYRFAQLFAATALLACMVGQLTEAARLYGAAEVLRSLSGTAVPADRRHEEQAMLDSLTEALGATAVDQLLTLGRALQHTAAVACAQQVLDHVRSASAYPKP